MSNYTPPNQSPNYMTSDWGNSQVKYTAMGIDHLADKAKFAIQMLEVSLSGFDTIEKEIVDASNATTPITREGLRAFSYRIDAQQNQIRQSLSSLKEMMTDIDKVTDHIQKPKANW